MFGKVERQRLSGIVASDIEKAILVSSFAIGERLPSEQELADQFGVSRNVVREAFKLLQERGLISIANGTGAFVARPSSEATSNALSRYLRLTDTTTALAELYQTRRILEGANARLAAEHADKSDIAELEGCVARMRKHIEAIDHWSQADLEFHLVLAKATHNRFQRMLLEPLVDQLRDVIAGGYLAPGGTATGLLAHEHLLECIKRRDPDGSYDIILGHLDDSEAMVTAALANQGTDSGT
jgi:GntR family transcriptional repressor for pyruvate dehydrogenase complex